MLLNRLKSTEGHIRGVERMVEDGAYCIDVIRQVQAVQRAGAVLSHRSNFSVIQERKKL